MLDLGDLVVCDDNPKEIAVVVDLFALNPVPFVRNLCMIQFQNGAKYVVNKDQIEIIAPYNVGVVTSNRRKAKRHV